MALTPLLYNLGIIVGGLVGGQTGQISGFSWGALVGAALGGLAVPVWSARGQLRPRWLWRPTDPEIRRFLWVAAPLMLGVSLTTVDEWLAKRYASSLPGGAISWLMSARRLMLVPIGLLGTAAGQAAGTYLAKLHAEGQRDELARLLAGSLAAVISLSLVLTAGLLPMAPQVVALLYQYGRFTAEDAQMTALALVPLSLGIAAWGGQQVLARAFYATGDTWRPMLATTAVTLLMLPVYDALAHWRGHEIQGLCLAGTIGITVQVLVLAALARRRLGLDVRTLLVDLGRALTVAAACLIAVRLTQRTVVPQWRDWLATLPLPIVAQRLLTLVPPGLAWLAALALAGGAFGMSGLPRPLARWMAPRRTVEAPR
jgi:putative peptidoglycan lipid II flippase